MLPQKCTCQHQQGNILSACRGWVLSHTDGSGIREPPDSHSPSPAAPCLNHNGKRWEETPSHFCIHHHSEGCWQRQRRGGRSTKSPTWAWLNLQPRGNLQHFPVPGQFTSEPGYLLQYCGRVLQPACRGL